MAVSVPILGPVRDDDFYAASDSAAAFGASRVRLVWDVGRHNPSGEWLAYVYVRDKRTAYGWASIRVGRARSLHQALRFVREWADKQEQELRERLPMGGKRGRK